MTAYITACLGAEHFATALGVGASVRTVTNNPVLWSDHTLYLLRVDGARLDLWHAGQGV